LSVRVDYNAPEAAARPALVRVSETAAKSVE